MSPRKNRRTSPDPRRERSGSGGEEDGGALWAQRKEEGPDGEWNVRMVAGASAVKAYRCPGCDQEIPPGTGHIVAWPADGWGDAGDRRHWHRPCWQARDRRGPRTFRSRDAPRH